MRKLRLLKYFFLRIKEEKKKNKQLQETNEKASVSYLSHFIAFQKKKKIYFGGRKPDVP